MPLSWRTLLQALSAQVPTQLRGVSAGAVQGSVRACDDGRVSWEAFGGYKEQRVRLQEMLRLLHLSAMMTSSSDSTGDDTFLESVRRSITTTTTTTEAMVEQQQHHPVEDDVDRFYRFGIVPPRGMVIYGPHGCGKSYLASIIAAEVIMTAMTSTVCFVYLVIVFFLTIRLR